MFKIRTKQTVTILSIIISSLIWSCKDLHKDLPTGPSYSPDPIIGKWIVEKLNIKGSVDTSGINITKDTSILIKNDNNYIQFDSNNTYNVVVPVVATFLLNNLQNTDMLSKIIQTIESVSGTKITKSMECDIDTSIWHFISFTGTWSLSGTALTLRTNLLNLKFVVNTAITGNYLNITKTYKKSIDGKQVDIVATIYLRRE